MGQIPKSIDSLKTFLNTRPKDSTYVLALNDYAFLIIQEGNYEKGNEIIQQMEKLSSKLNYGTGFYKATNMKGVVEYSKQNPEKAMEYFKKCNEIIKKYKLPKKIYQNSLNNIGLIYNQMGDRENATKYAIELINFQEKNNLNPLKSAPYAQVGDNLKFYKKYKESLRYFQKALDIEINLKDNSGIAIGYNRIGNVYDDLDQNNQAIQYFKKGLLYAEKANYKLLECDLLVNLGRLFKNENKFIVAEKYLKKSETYSRDLQANQTIKVVCSNLGDLYFVQKKYELANKYYQEALTIAKEVQDADFSYSANQSLADLYELKGDYKRAFAYKVDAESAKDSIFKIKTLENTEDLLRKYQTEKKEQEIKALSIQNKLKNLQLDTANKQKYYFIGGLLLLAIIGSLLYYQSRNRKKTNEKLQILNQNLDQANKAKTRFFSILNHDLRGPVANLVFFLQLQKESPEMLDEESTKRMQDKTISGAENLLNSMEDILQWSKSQMENFKPQPKIVSISNLFEDTKSHFASEEKVKIEFENKANIQINTDENYLKTVIRNLTGNAIKALNEIENPTIMWKAWQENEKSFLSISDNGNGASDQQFKALYDDKEVVGINSGFGLHLIRDLAKAIDCEIIVDSTIGVGTTFVLKL
jgi:signal transduction histidine kinase